MSLHEILIDIQYLMNFLHCSLCLVSWLFSCHNCYMTITQTVTIPPDYRISFELPRSVPAGVLARIEINIPAVSSNAQSGSAEIDEVRQLLRKEMAEKGTSQTIALSGDGWEAHARERYAEP